MVEEPQRVKQLPKNRREMDEVEDLQREIESNGFYEKIYSAAEKFAATQLGQLVIERGDRLLQTIEDTAKWSLPQDKNSTEELIRPFNWLVFLALIVLLRFVRIGLSIASLLIGNSPVTAQDMVYFLQTRRRKLRAVRIHGLKEIQRREEEANALRCGTGCFTSRISALLSIAICRPGQHREPGRRVFVRRGCTQEFIEGEGEGGESANRPACLEDDECEDHNLTVDQLLSKYVDENSDEDPDFVPPPEDEESSDTSITSSNSSSSSSSKTTAEEQEGNAVKSAKAESSEKPTQATAITKTSLNKSLLDQSLELQKNGDHNSMPRPFFEIKREPLSDIESASEQQQEDIEQESPYKHAQPSNGTEDKSEESEESKSDELSSVKPKEKPALSATATAASSRDDHALSPRPLSPSHLLSSSSSLPLNRPPLTEQNECDLRSASIVPATPPPSPNTEPPWATPLSTTTTGSSESPLATAQLESSPSPAPLSASSDPCGCENPTLTSASSTEDIFYSPIGSPPEFDVCFKLASILQNSAAAEQPAVGTDFAHSSPQITEECAAESPDAAAKTVAPPLPKKPLQQQQQKHHHPNKNRYRGRNRR